MNFYQGEPESEPHRDVRRVLCEQCGEMRPIPSSWQRRICASCRDGDPVPKRCSRCGFFKPKGPGWGSTHCPPCHRLDAKESRARRKERLKEAPPPTPEMRVCTQCGVGHEWPTPGWRDRTCPPCTRKYHRFYKLTHPPKTAPDVRLEKADFKKCSHCRQRVLYHPREQWKDDICGRCHKQFRKIAKANRKAKVEQWKQNATPVECRTCSETKTYGVGWDWNQCPECVSARAKASYAKLREDPERLEHRNKVQAAAEVKRTVKRNKERRESAPGPDSAPPSRAGDVPGG